MFRSIAALFVVCTVLAVSVTAAPAQAQSQTQAQVPADSKLKSILDKKSIRIGYRTDAAPFAFVNARNEPAGFSLDLCQMVVKSIA